MTHRKGTDLPGGIEPELGRRTPRPVRHTFRTQASRLFLLLLLVGSVLLVSLMGIQDVDELTALQAHGTAAAAHVTGKHESHGKSTTYRLDYSFTGNGEDVAETEDVPQSEYDAAKIGGPIDVTYLPSHPETHRIGPVDADRVSGQRTKWTLGVLATLAVFGGIFRNAEAAYRNRRRLLVEGVPVVGTVTDRTAVRGKSTTFSLSYRYPAPDGDRTKKITVSRAVYDQCLPHQPLTILYDPTRPDNSLPYRAITTAVLKR